MDCPTSYEDFALQYDKGSADNVYNALLDRPAVQSKCPPLEGRRVLEAGCAGGRLTQWLVDQEARVVAVDASPTLVGLAHERLGDRAELRVHDIAQPFDFLPDASVDVVVSSLTLHYLKDWVPALAEFRRVLAPGGTVVMSTHHPLNDFEISPSGDYFRVEELRDEWPSFGPPTPVVRFYRRPLGRMIADVHHAGLVLRDLYEPRAEPAQRERFGERFDKLSRKPWFLVLVLGHPGDPHEGGLAHPAG
ncbi:Methyltransferase domain-containing protein [Sinosporangium album]|uniref:Methyltransferase domain-containing protein n=1 Tax=Sinosporangium album TaxID=504805 RepID=A0A1G7QKN1_9ACTN|nr:methyltransferase domain-containing protein [Sinosporangium album]SDF99038.1 Methyltransferase domain-containing protein [Sinosporangium album]